MEYPPNTFKRRLRAGEMLYGLWVNLTDPLAAEISAGAGFDWLLIDGEHAPNDVPSTLAQVQAIEGYPTEAIVRPPRRDPELLKPYLDMGVRSFLIPMVESAELTVELVRATRYPPAGTRGVAYARASHWGRAEGYWERANDETCLIVQIESIPGMERVEEIAAVEGADCLFVGAADLGAALGHLGAPTHPEVVEAVTATVRRIRSAGKPAGVLVGSRDEAEPYVQAGATFVGAGVDAMLLASITTELARRCRELGGNKL